MYNTLRWLKQSVLQAADSFSWHLPITSKDSFNKKIQSIWIVGQPHSGTSITMKLLSHHCDIYFIPNESRIGLLNRYRAQSIYSAWVVAALEEKKVKLLEKSPIHINYINRICALNTNSKVLICIRRPSSNFISILLRRSSFYSENPLLIDDVFKIFVARYQSILCCIEKFNGSVVISRLESLIGNTLDHLSCILPELNLSASNESIKLMLDEHSSSGVYAPYSGDISKIGSGEISKLYSEVSRTEHDLRRDMQMNLPIFRKEPVLSADDFPFLSQDIKSSLRNLDMLLGYLDD